MTVPVSGNNLFVEGWELRYYWNGSSQWVNLGSCRTTSYLASGSHDGTVVLWDLSLLALQGNMEPLYSVAFSPEGSEIVVAGEDGDIRRWDLSGREAIGQRLAGHRGSRPSPRVPPGV